MPIYPSGLIINTSGFYLGRLPTDYLDKFVAYVATAEDNPALMTVTYFDGSTKVMSISMDCPANPPGPPGPPGPTGTPQPPEPPAPPPPPSPPPLPPPPPGPPGPTPPPEPDIFTLTSSIPTVEVGESFVATLTLVSGPGTGTPTVWKMVFNGVTQTGTWPIGAQVGTTATATFIPQAVGTFNLTGGYNNDSASAPPLSIPVFDAASALSVSASAPVVNLGQSFTATLTVVGGSSPLNRGWRMAYDNLSSDGVFTGYAPGTQGTWTVTPTRLGPYQLNGAFWDGVHYSDNASPVIVQVVSGSAPPPGASVVLGLSVNTTSITLGQSFTATLTVISGTGIAVQQFMMAFDTLAHSGVWIGYAPGTNASHTFTPQRAGTYSLNGAFWDGANSYTFLAPAINITVNP